MNKKISSRWEDNFLVVAANDVRNDEVDDGESEDTDNQTNHAVKDGVFGFFDFAGVARGSHILDATNNDDYDGDETKNANDAIDDTNDRLVESFAIFSFCILACICFNCKFC